MLLIFYILFIFITVFSPLLNVFYLFLSCERNSLRLIKKSIHFLILSVISSSFLFFYYVFWGRVDFSYSTLLWFYTNSLSVYWGLVCDFLSISMLFVVSLISFFVYLFSFGYMGSDPSRLRFFIYLNLFTFFMDFLVVSPSIIQLFFGWEGVGLCSFLLISFWSTRIAANKAAVKAMVVNKIGDCFLIFAASLLFQSCGTTDFFSLFFPSSTKIFESNTVFSTLHLSFSFFGYPLPFLDFVTLLIFFGVMAKSAQFGFHTWLPDAMEGPTPVSALIHAATMVTAGVFLLLRLSIFIVLSPYASNFIVIVGGFTAIFGAIVALVQQDIKKIIAYSTCSQLGYMVTAVGFGFFGAAFFHLTAHAFFKALLFLASGSVIHSLHDEQDLRRMGGIANILPITFVCFIIGSFNLMGFPFLSGYYSKDSILEFLLAKGTALGTFAYFWLVVSAFFTCLYSFRLLYLAFLQWPKGYKFYYKFSLKNNIYILVPLIALSLFSIFYGFLLGKIFDSQFNFEDYRSLFFSIDPIFRVLPLLVFFVALLIFILIVFFGSTIPFYSFYNFYSFLLNKWYIDSFFNSLVTHPLYRSGYTFFFKQLEKGWIELLGPTGLLRTFTSVGYILLRMQTNSFFSFILCTLSLLFMMFFFVIF